MAHHSSINAPTANCSTINRARAAALTSPGTNASTMTIANVAYRIAKGITTEYAATRPLDELRMNDFARLDEQDHVYLDYTGSGLYGAPQIRRHAQALLATILGNPHSANPTSQASNDLLEH